MHRLVTLLAVIAAALLLAIPGGAQDDYAQKNGWWFQNFETNPLPWDIYRDTFIGIPPSEDPWSSAFDVLFYEQVYKDKLSGSGNCYGMSLLSLMMLQKGGHLGFCLPVNQYSGDLSAAIMGPTEPMLTRAINVMHGHQVNLPTVQLLLDIVAQHKNRNASFAFSSFQAAHMQNDLTLVSITKSVAPGAHGHTLVAYDAVDLGGGNKKIFVYDPSRSWAKATCQPWYATGQNFIQITGDAWSFQKTDKTDPDCKVSETWSGDPGGGGNLIIVPISVTGPETRSPASLGDQVIGQVLNELFLTGDTASIEQVTDDRGKRLFMPGSSEVDTDPSTGMLTMVPWSPSDEGANDAFPATVLFHLGRSGSTLNVSVRAAESGYTLIASGARGRITIKSSGGRGTDVITLSQSGTTRARVAIENRRAANEYDVEFLNAVQPRERLRLLRSSHVVMPENARAEFAVAAQGDALSINSPTQKIRYDLELQNVTRRQTESLARKGVTHEAGTQQTVRPDDWSRLSVAQVLEETRLSPAPGVGGQQMLKGR